ncbi:Pol polyprotein, partial [Mucuna pruriens]
MALLEYDIIYVNQKAIKGSGLANHLAYPPWQNLSPFSMNFRMNTSRLPQALNLNGGGTILGFDCTNNMAEYSRASTLVIYQLHEEWEMWDAKFIPYHDHVKKMIESFDMVTFHHVPREENQMVDAFMTLSAMVQVNKGQKMTIHTYADHINVAPSTLHNLTSPWPFSMWGIDVIGPIEPKASNGHRFILVAIDYFTKWVEVASYPNVTRSIVVRFIKRDIICHYGLPAHIITNNDTNLNNKVMAELCKQFQIRHHNLRPIVPK